MDPHIDVACRRTTPRRRQGSIPGPAGIHFDGSTSRGRCEDDSESKKLTNPGSGS